MVSRVRRFALVCGVLGLALTLAPAIATARPPRARTADAVLRRALRGLVAMPWGPPGAVAVVQRGTRRRLYRAGVRDVRSGAAITGRDHMRIASTAKAFSGAVALALVSRGVLSLNATIAQLLPALPAPWGAVTIGEALNHTSGLPDFTRSKKFHEFAGRHPKATPAPMFMLRFVASEGLVFKPGSRYEYSNTDNIVVALMAEAATHRSYNSLLASLVYAPLGLSHTSLPRGTRMPSPYLHGYQPDPPRPPEDISSVLSGALSWASGGMVSTPADLNRFIRGYVGARLFSRRVRAQQLRLVAGHSEPIGPGANMAGLAIFRYRTRCGTVYGHTGNIPGYTQFMAATLNGRRSVTVSVSGQLSQNLTGRRLAVFKRLRRVEETAVCAALATR